MSTKPFSKEDTDRSEHKQMNSLAAAKQNQGSLQTEQVEVNITMNKETMALEKLQKLSINRDVDDMRKFAKSATHIVGRMALAGQITVLYAGPNTGKTLLTLKLIAEAIANGSAGKAVYHINLDDTYDGLITKADLGNRHGFEVISPNSFTNPNRHFADLVDFVIAEHIANETVLVLDTIKKFADVMDKKASSLFMTTCRRLTSAGGSIIALAHINKHKGEDDKGIPAGTSDVLDDCDCAYVIGILSEEQIQGGLKRTVEFTNLKARGPVVQSSVYSYINYEDGDYNRMFDSVKLIDGNEVDKLRVENATAAERNQDADLINHISNMLRSSGITIQKDIVSDVCTSSCAPRRKVLACLQRWSSSHDEGGLWTVTIGPKNSKLYELKI